MLDNTQSIICAFGLASAVPRSPYRHLELCDIVLPPDKASLRLIIPNWIIRRRDFLYQTRKPKLNGCTTASTMPLSNAAGCTPAGPGPAAPPDDEQYRGRPLPGGASDRGLTLRQGREKAYVFFGEEKSRPLLLQIAPPVMLARLGVGFCFADTGRRPLT